MSKGFSLVELILALLVLQVGLLGAGGMVFLAQKNIRRASLTLRGLVEAGWVADSLAREGAVGSGGYSLPWGDISWGPSPSGMGGLRVVALSVGEGDTLAVVLAWPPLPDSLLSTPPATSAAPGS